ncbi:TRAP transporter substrate-binding protein [Salinicola rhizosphaerae]|uniref:Transporter n=1 Tax=Salinicola rhizosphaerae TaxID=1443141 RepID=A0ABQ3DYC6_9GAMM|nr:TRAP transporter substrate-binding protein [Salinicola rhizosphaerae]GHB17808.1 transporter [Salinicola rhizosphaerae]
MKKTLLGLTLTALAAGMAQSATADTSLNVVGTWSAVSLHKNFEKPFWTKTLPEASDGKIQVQMTTFDQMGIEGSDVFTYLKNGLFNVGMTFSDYVGGEAPALEGLDLPMMTTDPKKAREVSEAFMPIAEKTMQSHYNAHVLAIAPNTPQVVFCNTPIEGLGDLQGKKVRASGRTTAEFLSAVGAQSTVMAFNEVPGALERGVIDCAVTGSLSGYNSGWQDVADYLLPLPIGGWDTVITAVSNDTWNSLDDETKQTIEDQIEPGFIDPVWNNLAKDEQQGIACLTGKGECEHGKPGDMTLVDVTDADRERAHQALVDAVLPSWASRIDDETISLWNENVAPLVALPIVK